MIKKGFHIILVCLVLIFAKIESQAQFIPVNDTVFARFLCDSFPQVMSGDCKQLDTVQAKLLDCIINAEGYDISDITEIVYFHLAQRILFPESSIQSLPDLSHLSNLTLINFNGNNLSGVLDFSKYTRLTNIILNRNYEITGIIGLSQLANLSNLQLINCNLSSAPDIITKSSLTKVYLYYNNLTFTDIIPLTNHVNFATGFTVFPQRNVPITDTAIQLIEGDELSLQYIEDATLAGLTYTWYYNNSVVKSSSENFITIPNIQFANQGNYFVSVTSNNALLGLDDSLTSRLYTVQVAKKPCIQPTNYSISHQSYCDSIEVKVSLGDIDTTGYSFYFEKNFNKEKTYFQNNINKKLRPGTYSIIATNGNDCIVTIEENRSFDFADDCKKYFTPNGDGDGDTWAIQDIGIVKIINTQGITIKELNCPSEWDGTTNSNSLAPDGKYILVIPNGKNISISLFR